VGDEAGYARPAGLCVNNVASRLPGVAALRRRPKRLIKAND
jgi:hypothetical protein